MRFNKKKLMEKRIPALQAIAFIEGIDTSGLAEISRDSLSDIILLMAGDVYPHTGPPPNLGPGFQAPNQDPVSNVSVRVQRIRDSSQARALSDAEIEQL